MTAMHPSMAFAQSQVRARRLEGATIERIDLEHDVVRIHLADGREATISAHADVDWDPDAGALVEPYIEIEVP